MRIKQLLKGSLLVWMLLSVAACVNLFTPSADLMVRPSAISILVLKPGHLYKEYLNENAKESDRDTLLNFIQDSLLIDAYYQSFIARLRNIGFNVFEENRIESFLGDSSGLIILNLSQISLEEYLMSIRKEEEFYEAVYYQDFVVKAVSINVWTEFQRLNASEPQKVFFASSYISDKVEGQFQRNVLNREVVYNYNLRLLQPAGVYTLARHSGIKHADYFFDSLLNIVLQKTAKATDEYMRFDRRTNKIIPAGQERYFEIPTE